MAIPAWPSTLPNDPLVEAYEEALGANVLSTPMDQGPAKRRLRGVAPGTLNISFPPMTKEQVATLETFVVDTIKVVNRFSFRHPRKLTTVEARIAMGEGGRPYTARPFGTFGSWLVDMTLEIMP